MTGPTYLNFDNENYYWKNDIDYRKHPDLYRVGKGEQGVLICQPYKTEIGQFWRFKSPKIASISSEKIFSLFLNYLENNDFVGADLARKYLQMGFTRSKRYANYKNGKKYDASNNYTQLERGTGEEQKAVSAEIFFNKWQEAENNEVYKPLKQDWKKTYG